ncbi:hypothetical protein [Janthinobacterium sp. PC23-8]|uniref:hypothetical protein n=1 Tax=Janthinobacterium sp. PC23-8 TaxID=2012679 RepID=UPI000B9660E8|nr:hypothetical protein [Janthinobacterium sp. PC23-8]OYO27904.1 hypothetical protein CD932_22595 [Janthinobacterium sp. PC23-8]
MEWFFGIVALVSLFIIYGSLTASEGRLQDISILIRHQNADRIEFLEALDSHMKTITSDLAELRRIAYEYEVAPPKPTAEQYVRALAVVSRWNAVGETE